MKVAYNYADHVMYVSAQRADSGSTIAFLTTLYSVAKLQRMVREWLEFIS